MTVRFAAVLLVLLFSGLIVVSAYEPGTNAERLALGLPPKRPISFGRIMPGYRDYRVPTPTTRT
jgi:hypothetical protein